MRTTIEASFYFLSQGETFSIHCHGDELRKPFETAAVLENNQRSNLRDLAWL